MCPLWLPQGSALPWCLAGAVCTFGPPEALPGGAELAVLAGIAMGEGGTAQRPRRGCRWLVEPLMALPGSRWTGLSLPPACAKRMGTFILHRALSVS